MHSSNVDANAAQPMPRLPSAVADVSPIRAATGPVIHPGLIADMAVVRVRAEPDTCRAIIERVVRSPDKFLIAIGTTRVLGGCVLTTASAEQLTTLVLNGVGKAPVSSSFTAVMFGIGLVLSFYGIRDISYGKEGLRAGNRGTALPNRFLSMKTRDNAVLIGCAAVFEASGITGHTLLKNDFGWWTPSTGMTVIGTLLTVQALACLYRQHVLTRTSRQDADDGRALPELHGQVQQAPAAVHHADAAELA